MNKLKVCTPEEPVYFCVPHEARYVAAPSLSHVCCSVPTGNHQMLRALHGNFRSRRTARRSNNPRSQRNAVMQPRRPRPTQDSCQTHNPQPIHVRIPTAKSPPTLLRSFPAPPTHGTPNKDPSSPCHTYVATVHSPRARAG